MTDSLVVFLNARLDEDEKRAEVLRRYAPPRPSGYRGDDRPLRECEAKRRILNRHRLADSGHSCTEDERVWPCGTLRTLAEIYGDHPDYRAEWKP